MSATERQIIDLLWVGLKVILKNKPSRQTVDIARRVVDESRPLFERMKVEDLTADEPLTVERIVETLERLGSVEGPVRLAIVHGDGGVSVIRDYHDLAEFILLTPREPVHAG